MIDAFERIEDEVHKAVEGATEADLTFRPTDSANSMAWLVWHLTRIQDDHIADLAKRKQIWDQEWHDKFGLHFKLAETGWGQTAKDVAAVRAGFELLLGYFDTVHVATIEFVGTLQEEDYATIVDTRWNPPVTLAVRLISIIADDLQHVGQAAYIGGLVK
jgi:hypothetical protein